MPSTAHHSIYLNSLEHSVLVFDGAMGTSIQDRELSPEAFAGHEGCNEFLIVSQPSVLEDVHASFLEAGCDVIETNTFGASRLKLGEYGLEDQTVEINRAAARLARDVADRFSSPAHPRFVAGAIGPTGMLPSTDDPLLGRLGFDELAQIFYEQARALIEG